MTINIRAVFLCDIHKIQKDVFKAELLECLFILSSFTTSGRVKLCQYPVISKSNHKLMVYLDVEKRIVKIL